MRRYDDDLAGFAEDPVVRALTAPGTAAELANEPAALAAYRSTGPRRLRLLRRVGTGGTALAVTLLASGGVAAAAYREALPSPLQSAVHAVLGPIGVPAPAPRHASAQHTPKVHQHASAPTLPVAATSMAPPSTPPTVPAHSAGPARHPASGHATKQPHHQAPAAGPGRGSPTPAATTPPASVSPAPSPSSSPTLPPQPATVTADLNQQKVPVGGTVELSGQLTDANGRPVPHHRARVWERDPGGDWRVLAITESGDQGTVTVKIGALEHNERLQLRSDHKRSPALPVVVLPSMTASAARNGAADTVSVSTHGGDPGDQLQVWRKLEGQWRRVQTVSLDPDGGATITVHAPKQHPKWLRLILPRTAEHGWATTGASLPPAQPKQSSSAG